MRHVFITVDIAVLMIMTFAVVIIIIIIIIIIFYYFCFITTAGVPCVNTHFTLYRITNLMDNEGAQYTTRLHSHDALLVYISHKTMCNVCAMSQYNSLYIVMSDYNGV